MIPVIYELWVRDTKDALCNWRKAAVLQVFTTDLTPELALRKLEELGQQADLSFKAGRSPRLKIKVMKVTVFGGESIEQKLAKSGISMREAEDNVKSVFKRMPR